MIYKCKDCGAKTTVDNASKELNWDPQAIRWQCPCCGEWQTPPIEKFEGSFTGCIVCNSPNLSTGTCPCNPYVSKEECLLANSVENKAGVKHDDGNLKPRLIIEGFARALIEVAAVGTFGANKYTENGWESVENGVERYTDAMYRHLLREAKGECNDQESELSHAAHAAWNALARLELMLREERDANTDKNSGASLSGTPYQEGLFEKGHKCG